MIPSTRRFSTLAFTASLAFFLCANTVHATTPLNSYTNTFSVASVQDAGSDTASKYFSSTYLSSLQKIFQAQDYSHSRLVSVDPANLDLASTAVRFYNVDTATDGSSNLNFLAGKRSQTQSGELVGSRFEGNLSYSADRSGSFFAKENTLMDSGQFIDFDGMQNPQTGWLGAELTTTTSSGKSATSSLYTGKFDAYTSGDYKLYQIQGTDYYYGELAAGGSANRIGFAFTTKPTISTPEPATWALFLVIGGAIYILKSRKKIAA